MVKPEIERPHILVLDEFADDYRPYLAHLDRQGFRVGLELQDRLPSDTCELSITARNIFRKMERGVFLGLPTMGAEPS